RRQLAPLLEGRRIVESHAWLPRITFPDTEQFVRGTQGRRVLDACRRGKQLYFPLDDGSALLVHLGMSGRLFTVEPLPGVREEPGGWRAPMNRDDLPKHTHALFCFEGDVRVLFVDPRTFGKLRVTPDLSFLDAMGPDP